MGNLSILFSSTASLLSRLGMLFLARLGCCGFSQGLQRLAAAMEASYVLSQREDGMESDSSSGCVVSLVGKESEILLTCGLSFVPLPGEFLSPI